MKKETATLVQLATLVLAGAAVIVGVFAVLSVIFAPPPNDWAGLTDLGVIVCWAVNVPLCLLTLALGLKIKSGSPRLRRLCIATALVALSLPIVASFFLYRWNRLYGRRTITRNFHQHEAPTSGFEARGSSYSDD